MLSYDCKLQVKSFLTGYSSDHYNKNIMVVTYDRNKKVTTAVVFMHLYILRAAVMTYFGMAVNYLLKSSVTATAVSNIVTLRL